MSSAWNVVLLATLGTKIAYISKTFYGTVKYQVQTWHQLESNFLFYKLDISELLSLQPLSCSLENIHIVIIQTCVWPQSQRNMYITKKSCDLLMFIYMMTWLASDVTFNYLFVLSQLSSLRAISYIENLIPQACFIKNTFLTVIIVVWNK